MRIIPLNKLQPGDTLGKSLFNDKGELLLASGYTLTQDMISLVFRHGFRFVYIMDEITKDIQPEEVIADNIRQGTSREITKTFNALEANLNLDDEDNPDDIRRIIEGSKRLKEWVPMSVVREQVSTIIEEIVDHHVTMYTSLPMKSESGRDWQHAFDTTVLCILVAQHFRYDYKEMKSLGIAAMIHDLGRIVFPKINKKPLSEMTREERMILQEHPVYSMLLLQNADDGSYVEQTTVLQHHERFDGRGFPNRLRGCNNPPTSNFKNPPKTMYRHAEILAAVNVYDNFLSGSLDGNSYTPEEAITELVNSSGESFNPHVVDALARVVQCYPVGAPVRISKTFSGTYDKYYGVIVQTNPDDQSRPIVLLTNGPNGEKILPKVIHFTEEERYVKLNLVLD